MQLAMLAIPILFLAALAVACWGLVSPRRSPMIALVAGIAALLAAAGTWYNIGESAPIAWTIGVALAGVVGLASCIRQLTGRRGDSQGETG